MSNRAADSDTLSAYALVQSMLSQDELGFDHLVASLKDDEFRGVLSVLTSIAVEFGILAVGQEEMTRVIRARSAGAAE